MREAGRPYAGPDASRQAAARFGESMPPAEADVAEAELAVVEATCAAGTPLALVSQALDHTYGEQLRAQHQEEIALKWRLQNGALPMARQVQHGTPNPTTFRRIPCVSSAPCCSPARSPYRCWPFPRP
ncbi:hypothetical protein [Streptomyces sp. NBC_01006]|uniref:hypothetical protein n=1 Tax=Streptomyces sp. NBC_01006 TaxID=2903716 RepID=UPI00386CCF36|nr:hypothetical protein OG509_35245 [Streptomyces sp. NBC_01006]